MLKYLKRQLNTTTYGQKLIDISNTQLFLDCSHERFQPKTISQQPIILKLTSRRRWSQNDPDNFQLILHKQIRFHRFFHENKTDTYIDQFPTNCLV